MEKILFGEIPEKKRKQYLEDNATGIEKIGYTKPFEVEEIDQFKTDLAETDISINDKEEQIKELTKSLKDELKPLKEDRSKLLKNIKEKSEFVNEELYKFIDQEAGRVGFYDEAGILRYERGILSEERQTTIFRLPITGTEG
jgi:small-conductance mechanosensitive channel